MLIVGYDCVEKGRVWKFPTFHLILLWTQNFSKKINSIKKKLNHQKQKKKLEAK